MRPGTALTIELQEDSDVFAMLQALVAGKIISKELLFKDVTPEDRAALGRAKRSCDQVDWEISGDPFFYENRHTVAASGRGDATGGRRGILDLLQHHQVQRQEARRQAGSAVHQCRSGCLQHPGLARHGRYDGHEVEAGNFGMDELLVSHARATTPIVVENTGTRT